MLEHLVEQLGRLELAGQVAGDGAGDRLVDPGQPVVRDDLLVVVLAVGAGAVGVEVVEQPAGLVLLDVEAGEPQQPPRVVAGVDDLGLDLDRRAADVGRDGELVDVEAELVEPADPLVDPPPVAASRTARARSARPTARGSAVDDAVGRVDGSAPPRGSPPASRSISSPAMLTRAMSRSCSRWPSVSVCVQLAGLGVDEVCRERAGVAPEQGVGQRHVAPPEAGEVQPDEQHGQRVDEALRGVGPQRLAEQRAVGQRELQVPGDQARRRGASPSAALPAADHAERLDAGQVEPVEHPQHLRTRGARCRP